MIHEFAILEDPLTRIPPLPDTVFGGNLPPDLLTILLPIISQYCSVNKHYVRLVVTMFVQ